MIVEHVHQETKRSQVSTSGPRINLPTYLRMLSINSVNTACQHTRFSRFIYTYYQHTLSTHLINTFHFSTHPTGCSWVQPLSDSLSNICGTKARASSNNNNNNTVSLDVIIERFLCQSAAHARLSEAVLSARILKMQQDAMSEGIL